MTIKKENILTEMPKRNPINGTFEITVRCNLHCKMCMFRHDDKENPILMDQELTAKQWIDLARQVAEAGTFNLLITGGEPMLRPDFCEIWEGIYKQGFLISLYTNATLITPKIMEVLTKYPPHKIGITIYGSSPEIYQKVCGDGEVFHKMLQGVHQLKTLPSILEYRATIIKDNYDDIGRIEQLVEEEFGGHYVQQPRSLFPAVRGGCSDVKAVRLDPKDNLSLIFRRGIEEVKEIVGRDRFDPKNVRIEIVPPEEPECTKDKKYTLLGCDAGMNSYCITYDGKLQGCQVLGLFQTDVRKDGFQAAWTQFPYEVKLPPMNQKCQTCEIASHCETCYASRYAETGEICGCPDYQCQDAREKMKLM